MPLRRPPGRERALSLPPSDPLIGMPFIVSRRYRHRPDAEVTGQSAAATVSHRAGTSTTGGRVTTTSRRSRATGQDLNRAQGWALALASVASFMVVLDMLV